MENAREQSGPPLRRVVEQRCRLFVLISAGAAKRGCKARRSGAICWVGKRVKLAQSIARAQFQEALGPLRPRGRGAQGGDEPFAHHSGEVRCYLADSVGGAHSEILPPGETGDRLRPRVGLAIGVAHV